MVPTVLCLFGPPSYGHRRTAFWFDWPPLDTSQSHLQIASPPSRGETTPRASNGGRTGPLEGPLTHTKKAAPAAPRKVRGSIIRHGTLCLCAAMRRDALRCGLSGSEGVKVVLVLRIHPTGDALTDVAIRPPPPFAAGHVQHSAVTVLQPVDAAGPSYNCLHNTPSSCAFPRPSSAPSHPTILPCPSSSSTKVELSQLSRLLWTKNRAITALLSCHYTTYTATPAAGYATLASCPSPHPALRFQTANVTGASKERWTLTLTASFASHGNRPTARLSLVSNASLADWRGQSASALHIVADCRGEGRGDTGQRGSRAAITAKRSTTAVAAYDLRRPSFFTACIQVGSQKGRLASRRPVESD
ncbi:hypothetical protein CSOJ01_14203 [Colletotrichum sojae]|uniref:Uncharacterized protein n=1 Tax=Colletotrichum sojae TaxID=2175907 RepID=A0A8H6IQE9_9PEZI|nr:hypothetical protein CSOJ01_14203 [Colletotrichum sojae]